MPHLKFRGIKKELLIENSKEIIDGLTDIVKCDRTWFTLEHLETEYIFDGKLVPGYTFAEVFWFPREKEVKDQFAKFLTDLLKKINNNNDTCVMFFDLIGENYYDNGEHF
ncbi:MAG: DUF1904 domain-containing protein [Fusobacteriaceae bacterium]